MHACAAGHPSLLAGRVRTRPASCPRRDAIGHAAQTMAENAGSIKSSPDDAARPSVDRRYSTKRQQAGDVGAPPSPVNAGAMPSRMARAQDGLSKPTLACRSRAWRIGGRKIDSHESLTSTQCVPCPWISHAAWAIASRLARADAVLSIQRVTCSE